jgi:Flp pilus assembly CpaF family ATPase
MTGAQLDPPPQRYEIRVRGHLGAAMRRAFSHLHAEIQDGDTLLRGALPDQSALHGVLSQIEALGLELLELRRLPRSPAADEHPNV